MKYIYQLGVILLVAFAGEVCYALLPLPVPAGIYGLILMLLLLLTGLIKLRAIEDTADFLLKVMPVMFIPSAVGLMAVYELISGDILKLIALIVITTVVVMATTGATVQAVMRRAGRDKS